MQDKKKFNVYDMALVACLAALLFILEEALSFLPNIQLTIFLIVLYSKKLGFTKTSIIVIIHVILDNLVVGSFSILYTPSMFIGYLLIPLTLCTIFKKVNNNIILAILGAVYAFIYSWLFIPPSVILLDIRFIDYLLSDILFEVILASSSFLSILILYYPCSKALDLIMHSKD